MKVVPSNVTFCRQLIAMKISLGFQCFSRLSLIVPRAPIMTRITVALTSSSCVLKSLHFLMSSNSFALTLWSPGTAMLMNWTTFSLYQLSQGQALCVLFQFLSVLQNDTRFCISRFPAPALDDESITVVYNRATWHTPIWYQAKPKLSFS